MDKSKQDDFIWAKELILLNKGNIELEHKLKMERLLYERNTITQQHEQEKERMRIKSAEIAKAQIRRETGRRY